MTDQPAQPARKAFPRKRLAAAGVLLLLVLGFIPLPFQITDRDRELAISNSISALLENRAVLSDWRIIHLADTGSFKDRSRIYFQNELGIPDDLFLRLGLKPVPHDRKLDVAGGDVVLLFSYRNASGGKSKNIKLAYVTGHFGAKGYEIRIRRSLLKRYFVYLWQWGS
jgi:hypothetical protein